MWLYHRHPNYTFITYHNIPFYTLTKYVCLADSAEIHSIKQISTTKTTEQSEWAVRISTIQPQSTRYFMVTQFLLFVSFVLIKNTLLCQPWEFLLYIDPITSRNPDIVFVPMLYFFRYSLFLCAVVVVVVYSEWSRVFVVAWNRCVCSCRLHND